MTLRNFLKMHQDGVACVSISQLPYNFEKHSYAKEYFEEGSQEYITSSKIFKEIARKQVDHFCVIGGGIYRVELRIFLKEE